MAENIRVLIFEDYPKVEKKIRAFLKNIQGVMILDHDVNHTDRALEEIRRVGPDVVILGREFPGAESFNFTELIRKSVPATQVIIISEVVSTDLMRSAWRAEAVDFLCHKNLTQDEFQTSFERAVSLVEEYQESLKETKLEPVSEKLEDKPKKTGLAKIITLYGPKGGVGVSTLSTNLAVALSQKGRKVLLIDCDLIYGDIALLVNHSDKKSIADLARLIENLDEDLMKEVITEGGIDVIAAPPDPNVNVSITSTILEKVFSQAQVMEYDFVIINTDNFINNTNVTSFEHSDLILLILVQEVSAIRSIRMFTDLFETLDLDQNRLKLIVNRYDKVAGLSVNRISETLKMRIDHTIPVDYKTTLQSANLGIPFVIEDPKLPISKAMFTLADRIIAWTRR